MVVLVRLDCSGGVRNHQGSTATMLLVGCVMLFIAVVGSVGNATVVFVYGRNGKSRKQHFFILNLAALGAVGSLCYGIACYYIFSEKEMNVNGIVCQLYAFIISMLAVGSIHQLAVVSGERCLLVLKPFLAKKIVLRHKVMVVIGVYIFALLITSPPLFGWSQFTRNNAQHYCGFDYTSRDIWSRSYLAYLFMGAYIIPCAIIIISYVVIFRVVLQSDRRRLSASLAMRRYSTVEGSSKSDLRRQLKIAKLMLIVISAFLISWTPYACLAVIWQLIAADTSPHPDIVHAAAIFGKMFVIWNPIIYGIKDRNFRRQLGCCRRLQRHRATDDDHDETITKHSATPTKRNSRLLSVISNKHANNTDEETISSSLISHAARQRHWSARVVSALLRSGADLELNATDL